MLRAILAHVFLLKARCVSTGLWQHARRHIAPRVVSVLELLAAESTTRYVIPRVADSPTRYTPKSN
eukprot:103088-Rhodomonas_salina.4